MARAATSSDVFNALAEQRRRDLLDALFEGEAGVGELGERLALTQPQVSKHLQVLRAVDLVRCRSVGRRRMYRLNEPALQPMRDWLSGFVQRTNEHHDRLDDHLVELQRPAPEQFADLAKGTT